MLNCLAQPALAQTFTKDEIKTARKYLPQYEVYVHEHDAGTSLRANVLLDYRAVAEFKTTLGDYAGAIAVAQRGLAIAAGGGKEPATQHIEKEEILRLTIALGHARQYAHYPAREVLAALRVPYGELERYLDGETEGSTILSYDLLQKLPPVLNDLQWKILEEDAEADFKVHPQDRSLAAEALALGEKRNFPGVIAKYDQLVANAPETYLWWAYRAIGKNNNHDYAGSLPDFAKALTLTTGVPAGWLRRSRGITFHNMDKEVEALQDLTVALKEIPWDEGIRADRFDVQKALAKLRSPAAYAKYISGLTAFEAANAVSFSERAPYWQQALRDTKDAVDLAPNEAAFYPMRVRALMDRYPVSEEDHQLAVEIATSAYTLDPQNASIIYYLGHAYQGLDWFYGDDKPKLALKYLRIAHLLLPGDTIFAKRVEEQLAVVANGSPAEQAQRRADNEIWAARQAARQKELEEIASRKRAAPDYNSNMQAWCDSIGASGMTNMAAVPPACFAFIRK